jgi:hypothetical protein
VVTSLSTASVATFNGSLVAKCEVCRRQIVVDGLGNADDVESLLKERLRNTLRSVAADVDHGLNTLVLQAANESSDRSSLPHVPSDRFTGQ